MMATKVSFGQGDLYYYPGSVVPLSFASFIYRPGVYVAVHCIEAPVDRDHPKHAGSPRDVGGHKRIAPTYSQH
jgi:hypothetical protein